MTRSQARGLCLAEAARVVLLHGPGVHVDVANEDVPVVFAEARALAEEFSSRAAVLGVAAPVQLENQGPEVLSGIATQGTLGELRERVERERRPVGFRPNGEGSP
jgi:hypothetical protein